MKIHWLQHVEFEGLGLIAAWIDQQGHGVSCTRLYHGELPPDHEDIDMLIIMGGPMGIHDEDVHPWLIEEKRFIRTCLKNHIPTLGICLGAQLLADALGGEVRANAAKEIGWFPIKRCLGVEDYSNLWPESLTVLHWHGDTFSLPPEAVHLYSSIACTHQAFICRDRFVGLQFHLEIGERELPSLINNCRHELVQEQWIQSEEELLDVPKQSEECSKVLSELLGFISSKKKE